MDDVNDTKKLEYYERFPSVLKKSLKTKRVQFPVDLMLEYAPMEVYRSVRIVKNVKETITMEDFYSQAERNLPGIDFDDIGNYSCSFFGKIEDIWEVLHYPRKNKKIAKGVIYDRDGPIIKEIGWSHIHCFLYEGVELSDRFEVIEYEKMDNS